MTIIIPDEDLLQLEWFRAEGREIFLGGKLRVDWSQTRGGWAIFVSGRMEGQLFDSQTAAADWLWETHEIHIEIS